MTILGDPSGRFDCDQRECVYVERIGYRPPEAVYSEDPGYPEPETIRHYGYPQLREFVDWRQGRDTGRGHQWIGIWRGWCIRVYAQLDSYRGRNVVRWYADCDGRARVHGQWSAEDAQQAACAWVEAEVFN